MFKIIKNDTPNPVWINEWVFIKSLENPRVCVQAYDNKNSLFYYDNCDEKSEMQRFKVTETDDGKYMIATFKGRFFMNVDGKDDNINIMAVDKNEKSLSQKWTFEARQEGPAFFNFKNALTGKCPQRRGSDNMRQFDCAKAEYVGHSFFPVDPTFRQLNSKPAAAPAAPEPSTAAKPAGFLQLN